MAPDRYQVQACRLINVQAQLHNLAGQGISLADTHFLPLSGLKNLRREVKFVKQIEKMMPSKGKEKTNKDKKCEREMRKEKRSVDNYMRIVVFENMHVHTLVHQHLQMHASRYTHLEGGICMDSFAYTCVCENTFVKIPVPRRT